jgi:TRAP-type transport system small permease protein
MKKLIDGYCKLLEVFMALALAVMVVLVFGNVVLRYAFNTGITVSEELSRWLFVWVTFLGAIVAMHDHGHLGTDMVVAKLGPTGKKVCLFIGQVLMLYVCWLLFDGALAQAKINLDVTAPVTGMSVAVFYASGVMFAVSAALFLIRDFIRLVTGKMSESEMVMVTESEDLALLEGEHGPGSHPHPDSGSQTKT